MDKWKSFKRFCDQWVNVLIKNDPTPDVGSQYCSTTTAQLQWDTLQLHREVSCFRRLPIGWFWIALRWFAAAKSSASSKSADRPSSGSEERMYRETLNVWSAVNIWTCWLCSDSIWTKCRGECYYWKMTICLKKGKGVRETPIIYLMNCCCFVAETINGILNSGHRY